MAAIVCHGLPSCLEPQSVEPRIHRLRLPSSKSLPSQAFKYCFWDSTTKTHFEENNKKTETVQDNPKTYNYNPGWSFIQALSNVSQGPKEPLDKETTTYVHPQAKLSSLRLSPKSLELCTENLGNETGTDIIENGIDSLSSSDCSGGNFGTGEPRKSRQLLGAKKERTQSFPPPLTTIRGSESLQVRAHREGGRLVIEVTKVPSSASCFHAERSHGRLRLCFLKNSTPCSDPEEDDNEVFEEEFESEMNGQRQDVEDEDEDEEEAEAEQEEEAEQEGVEELEDGDRDWCGCEKDTRGKSWYIGGGMKMEKYEKGRRRRSRCKEGEHENNEVLNWAPPLWVATS